MKRIATALVGIPLAVLLTLKLSDLLFALALSLVAAVCLDELCQLAIRRMDVRPGRWVLALGALVTLSFAGGVTWVVAVLAGAIMLAATIVTFGASLQEALPKLAVAVLGILYCCVLLGFLVLLQPEMRVVLLGVIWIGDAAAYYGGRSLGRHLLAPDISPKKTVEGAFAGLIGSVIAGVILGVLMTGNSPSILLVASFVAGCVGQTGDLVESAIKRSAGVKDSSSILPGHGGMLDRLDSVLFAGPVFYWFFGK
jgi:phosphatidate cytidylyltransferase